MCLDAGKAPQPWKVELNHVFRNSLHLCHQMLSWLYWETHISSSGELKTPLKPPPLGAQQSRVAPRLLDPMVAEKN